MIDGVRCKKKNLAICIIHMKGNDYFKNDEIV